MTATNRPAMRPHISFITLGVADLERSLAFYRDGLGLPTEGIVGQEFEHGAVVFIQLHGGQTLALFGRDDLALDAGVEFAAPSGAFSLAHNVRTRDEVGPLLERAATAGATIVKPAAETFYGGHAGYFQDPDGHLWEIAWNPSFELPDDA